jgi:N-acetylmuramoyl-L-alanine amidase
MNPNEFLICLDAGHGGLRPGVGADKYTTYPSKCFHHRQGNFHGYGWFFEGVFNRSVAAYLENYLLDYGFQVKKIYEPINDTSLNRRCQLVNAYKSLAQSSILVSIHGNAAESTKARGWEIFTTPGETKSDKLATFIGNEVIKATPGWVHRTDKTDGDLDREANFQIIKNTAMPAVLSENGFFTNYQDALLMIDKEWQENIAKAHAKGILEYAISEGVEW